MNYKRERKQNKAAALPCISICEGKESFFRTFGKVVAGKKVVAHMGEGRGHVWTALVIETCLLCVVPSYVNDWLQFVYKEVAIILILPLLHRVTMMETFKFQVWYFFSCFFIEVFIWMCRWYSLCRMFHIVCRQPRLLHRPSSMFLCHWWGSWCVLHYALRGIIPQQNFPWRWTSVYQLTVC